jgi:hypothetical protein
MSDIQRKKDGITSEKKAINIGALRRQRETTLPVSAFAKTSTINPELQVVLMFDITVSMFHYFDEVRKKLQEIILAVKKEISRSQFAVFAYRNHGDEEKHDQIYYASPLTAHPEEVFRFIQGIKRGGGGEDALTCMEDCFQEANKLAWNNSAKKAVVVIGDMPPHGVLDSVKKCYNGINYAEEIAQFKKKEIRIYSVFCGEKQRVRDFYQSIAKETGGRYLEIAEISSIADLLVGICMKETGKLDKFLASLREKNQLDPAKEKTLKALK